MESATKYFSVQEQEKLLSLEIFYTGLLCILLVFPTKISKIDYSIVDRIVKFLLWYGKPVQCDIDFNLPIATFPRNLETSLVVGILIAACIFADLLNDDSGALYAAFCSFLDLVN